MRRSGIFGPAEDWPAQDLIAFSADFDADLVVEAYRAGVFPMPLHASGFGEMGWWSPVRRGILTLEGLRVTRSMRKAARHYTTTVDSAFHRVLAACADPSRPNGWIDAEIERVYT
ncbi:MAG: leucyl/phenylalanyl-tRNA--protein transferase, partial [Propionicimonas sp.]|nr:leucyl/phenylalanyl-tRNA--protein transferase [Propionicimonas sp.]